MAMNEDTKRAGYAAADALNAFWEKLVDDGHLDEAARVLAMVGHVYGAIGRTDKESK